MSQGPPISNHVVDIPVDGMFATADWRVINRNGQNYYLACGETVYEFPEGGRSTCVKPVYHKTWTHEDMEGRQRDEQFRGVVTIDHQIRSKAEVALKNSGLDNEQIYNAINSMLISGLTVSKE